MRCKASIRIIGEFDPKEMPKKLSTMGSYTYLKGQKALLGHLIKDNVWIMNSPLEKTARLEKHLKWVEKVCKTYREGIQKIGRTAKVDVFCSVTAVGDEGFSIPAKLMTILGELGLKIEVSLVFLSSKEKT